MAATSAAIAAADLTARALDAPALLGLNIAQVAYEIAAANFVTNTTGTLAAGDTSATGFDRAFLVQRHRHKTWKGTSATTHYIAIDFGSASNYCDTLVIEGHNFDTATVTLEADDSVTPTAGAGAWGTSIFSFVQSGSTLAFKLHASTSYTGRYWRLKIVKAGAFVPEAKQLWIGKTLQVPARALLDSDLPSVGGGDFIELGTKGGIVYRYKNHGSLLSRAVSFLVQQSYASTFFTDLATFMSNAYYLDGGRRNFWWCDQPTTAPNSAVFVRLTEPMHKPSSRGPATGFSLEWKEIGS